MLNQSECNRPLEAEMKLLKELEARYACAIRENEAFVPLKKLYTEIKELKEKLSMYYPGQFSVS